MNKNISELLVQNNNNWKNKKKHKILIPHLLDICYPHNFMHLFFFFFFFPAKTQFYLAIPYSLIQKSSQFYKPMHTQINRHILYILLIDAYLVELLENKIFYSMGQNRNSTNEKKKRKVNLIVLSCKQIFHVFFSLHE